MAIKITKEEDNRYIIELNYNGGICYDFACLTEEKLISLHTKIGKILGVVDWQKEMMDDELRKFIDW